MKASFIVLILAMTHLLFGQNLPQTKQLNSIVQAKKNRIHSGAALSSELYSLIASQSNENRQLVGSLISDQELQLFRQKKISTLEEQGSILIRIHASELSDLASDLAALGFEETARSQRHHRIVGTLPLTNLLSLENLKRKGLIYAEHVRKPHINVGSVTSEADIVMGTEKARELMSGIDGSGIKIGVLSDTYDALGGEAAGITSGDLPNNVTVVEDLVNGTDEGRAMIELIHDMAPGAEILFATAFGGQENFAENIDTLAQLGCKIIVDDVFYFAEPFFQDGIVAEKVNEVVAEQGVTYFSSAGNSASNSYESTTIDFFSNDTISFYDFNFSLDSVEVLNEFVLDSGEIVTLVFQWDDPFFANNVDTDLDLFIFDADLNIVAQSIADNIAFDNPFEIVQLQSDADASTFFILIQLFTGPEPGRLKIINFGTGVPLAFDTQSPTIVGHAAAESAIAVGAIPFFNPVVPEPFTSAGPSTLLFNADGSLKSNIEIRDKPEIAAIDGTNNTFFGFDIADPDTFPNFFGTSAAAPHAAALGALICQANPSSTPQEIKQILIDGAIDIDDPGFDYLTGHGLVHALSSCIISQFDIDQALLVDAFTPSILRSITAINLGGSVTADQSFTFLAGEEILINPGFEVTGAMEANIKTCPE